MDWHRRYLQQAQWTGDLRRYVFQKIGVHPWHSLLEVGCGTGAILSELTDSSTTNGLDIDSGALAQCRLHAPAASLVEGDARQLPYADGSFDIVYCHFLLLWVSDPLQALLEMKRVARADAHIIAFAEPDYTARVDEPRELIPLGQWQIEALRRQGSDPAIGGRLADLFFQANIQLVETGTIQTAESAPSPHEWENEWAVIESDLAGMIPNDKIQEMKRVDQQARARRQRKLYVPTHFAWGRV